MFAGESEQEYRLRRYKELGIDPTNPNPDGSDYHLMNAVDDEIVQRIKESSLKSGS